jgi:hypothetical protein
MNDAFSINNALVGDNESALPVIYNYNQSQFTPQYNVGNNLRAALSLNVAVSPKVNGQTSLPTIDEPLYWALKASENTNFPTPRTEIIDENGEKVYTDEHGETFPLDTFMQCYMHFGLGSNSAPHPNCTGNSYASTSAAGNDGKYMTYDEIASHFSRTTLDASGNYPFSAVTTNPVDISSTKVNYVFTFLVSYSGRMCFGVCELGGGNDAFDVKPYLTVIDNAPSSENTNVLSRRPIRLWNDSENYWDAAVGNEPSFKKNPENDDDLGFNVQRDYNFDTHEYTMRGAVLSQCYDLSTLKWTAPPSTQWYNATLDPQIDPSSPITQFHFNLPQIAPSGINTHIRVNVHLQNFGDDEPVECIGRAEEYSIETILVMNAFGPKVTVDGSELVGTQEHENLYAANGRHYQVRNEEIWTNQPLAKITGTANDNGFTEYRVTVDGNIVYTDQQPFDMSWPDVYSGRGDTSVAWEENTGIDYPTDGVRASKTYSVALRHTVMTGLLGVAETNLKLNYLKRDLEAPIVEHAEYSYESKARLHLHLSDSEQRNRDAHPEENIRVQVRHQGQKQPPETGQTQDAASRTGVAPQIGTEDWADAEEFGEFEPGVYEVRAVDRYGNMSETVVHEVRPQDSADLDPLVNAQMAQTGISALYLLLALALLLGAIQIRKRLHARV